MCASVFGNCGLCKDAITMYLVNVQVGTNLYMYSPMQDRNNDVLHMMSTGI